MESSERPRGEWFGIPASAEREFDERCAGQFSSTYKCHQRVVVYSRERCTERELSRPNEKLVKCGRSVAVGH